MSGVRGMGLGMALTFGAVLWWAIRGTEPVAEGTARLREPPASHARADSANAWLAPAVKEEDPAVAPHPRETGAAAAASVSDAAFESYVFGKFRYLLESLAHAPHERLRAALLERERLVTAINTAIQGRDERMKAMLPRQRAQLAEVDAAIRRLLPASALATFEALKDSHMEWFQLDDFAQGIESVAPLAESDRRALLMSKVAYRARFREVLDQSGLLRGDLPVTQRHAALSGVSRALREAHDSFLQEARQHLSDDERYTLLANYEGTEYAAELEKLRRIASGDDT